MNILEKHFFDAAIFVVVMSSLFYMNERFNRLDNEVAIIKTVLLMSDIVPFDLD